jgi:hypothetical protein
MERRELEALKVEIEAAFRGEMAEIEARLAEVESQKERVAQDYQKRLDAVDTLLAMPLRNGQPASDEPDEPEEVVEQSESVQDSNKDTANRPENFATKSDWIRGVINELDGDITQATIKKRLAEIDPDTASTIQSTLVSKIIRFGVSEGALVQIKEGFSNLPGIYRRVKPLTLNS